MEALVRKFLRDLGTFFSTPPWTKDRDRIGRAADASTAVIGLCLTIIGAVLILRLVMALSGRH